jgi:hypothetical protein
MRILAFPASLDTAFLNRKLIPSSCCCSSIDRYCLLHRGSHSEAFGQLIGSLFQMVLIRQIVLCHVRGLVSLATETLVNGSTRRVSSPPLSTLCSGYSVWSSVPSMPRTPAWIF